MLKSYVVVVVVVVVVVLVVVVGGPQLFSVSPSPKTPGSFGIWVCLGLAWRLGLDLGLGFGTRA